VFSFAFAKSIGGVLPRRAGLRKRGSTGAGAKRALVPVRAVDVRQGRPGGAAIDWVVDTLTAPSPSVAANDKAAPPHLERTHLRLAGLYCAACAGPIETALRAEPGVISADVSYAAQRATVQWRRGATQPARLIAAVVRAGYGATPDLAEPSRARREREQRAALWRLFVAAFCMMQVMMYAAPAYVAAPGDITPDMLRLLQWASWLLSVPVLLFSAAPIFREAAAGLRRRQVRMDLPVAIGLAVTFVVSSGATFAPGGAFGREVYFDSLTMFVCFLLAGRWLTLRAQHRVAAALEDACARLPAEARRIETDGRVALVPLDALQVGDALRVLAGEAFVADGPLLDGRTQIDEALLTGESRPVERGPGEGVVAGSLNLGGPVTMRVDRLGADTRFEGIVALMRSALTQRPAVVQAADRLAVPFLWGVLLLAALAAAAWSVIDPSRAVWVAVSVLIVTCPCALSLAAPSALLAAAGALARRGVLVRRLDALEALAGIDTLIFDKTGTLTQQPMRLQVVHRLPAAVRAGLDDAALLRLAGALAAQSAHPLAQALARDAGPSDGAAWAEVVEHAGQGVQGTGPEGRVARLGARRWVDPETPALASGGGLEVWFGDGRGALACFGFDEVLKPDAVATLAALRGDGLRLALLSGDTAGRVQAVGARLHIDDVQGGVTPEAKLARLAALQAAGRRVGMVGDGLNDAPVIARADASFAFAQGAAITQSGADFVLLSGRVADVALARTVAKRALRVLRQNLAWALAYNLVCVPLALLGWFPPWAAGLGMATSSLFVVLNALRIGARG
jgi:Cu2+-exporting ATPase